MSKIYLHVGMPKTGTSYLQSLINLNHNYLEENTDFFFLTDRRAHELAASLIEDQRLKKRIDINELLNSFSFDVEDFLSLRTQEGKDCFCSSEYFMLCDKLTLVNYFKKYFDEIIIILTVRRQDRLIASGYNQDVKALGRTTNLNWNFTSSDYLQYDKVFETWTSLDCRVEILNYDKAKKIKSGIEQEIVERILGIKGFLGTENVIQPNTKGSNFSYSKNQVYLALTLNRMGVENQKLISDCQSEFEEFSLPRMYAQKMAARYMDGNRKIMAMFNEQFLESDFAFDGFNENTNQDDSFSWDPVLGYESLIKFLINIKFK